MNETTLMPMLSEALTVIVVDPENVVLGALTKEIAGFSLSVLTTTETSQFCTVVPSSAVMV